MTHYHALASFALGCGVNPEIDTPQGHCYEDPSHFLMNSYQGNPALGVIGTTSDSELTDSDMMFSPTTPPAYVANSTERLFDCKPVHVTADQIYKINHVRASPLP